MGKEFDTLGDSRRQQAWHEAWAREALRILKPGGWLIAAGGSRTYHRLTAGIEDAGFEIRDCLTWHFGSGFPKSRDVSKDLAALPGCSCRGGEEATPGAIALTGTTGLVEHGTAADADPLASGPYAVRNDGVAVGERAGLPLGPVGTRIGAEPRAVPLAAPTADRARGVGPNVGADAPHAVPNVQGRIEEVDGNLPPVVLRPGAVARGAARDDVGADVRRSEVNPEPLRDDVMGDGRRPSAVEARAIAEHVGADVEPADSLPLPLAATPSRVLRTSEPAAVGDGHAGPSAVHGDPPSVTEERGAALGADEGSHDLKCDRCGGVRRDRIPDGLGSALKPATEFMVLARKPLAGTLAANVLAYGTGAINVDACRIGAPDAPDVAACALNAGPRYKGVLNGGAVSADEPRATSATSAGRWPANAVFVHSESCRRVGERRVKGSSDRGSSFTSSGGILNGTQEARPTEGTGYADADGLETVAAWDCVAECVVRQLDEQSGTLTSGKEAAGGHRRNSDRFRTACGRFEGQEVEPGALYGDTGGASRFFFTAQHQQEPRFLYSAKASSAERNAGLAGFEAQAVFKGALPNNPKCEACDRRRVESFGVLACECPEPQWAPDRDEPKRNPHPTVKPVAVMRWLVRLVCPPGGVVLDPFVGSGTTGCAAALEPCVGRFVGIERDPEYAAIARARIRWWSEHPDGVEIVERLQSERTQARVRDAGQDALF